VGDRREHFALKQPKGDHGLLDLGPSAFDIHGFAPTAHSQQGTAALDAPLQQATWRARLHAQDSRVELQARKRSGSDLHLQEAAHLRTVTAKRKHDRPPRAQHALEQSPVQVYRGSVLNVAEHRLAQWPRHHQLRRFIRLCERRPSGVDSPDAKLGVELVRTSA